jgi:hypothetical protein
MTAVYFVAEQEGGRDKEQLFASSTPDYSFLQKCPMLKPHSQPKFDCPNVAENTSEWF